MISSAGLGPINGTKWNCNNSAANLKHFSSTHKFSLASLKEGVLQI